MKFLSHWCRNEKEVETKFIAQFLLPKLDYSYQDWYQEVRYKDIRIDFLLIPQELNKVPFKQKRNAYVIIEAKHPKEKLDLHIPKFRIYLKKLKIKYGLITNAEEIRLYKLQKDNIYLLLQYKVRELHKHIIKLNKIIGKNTLINQVTKNLDSDILRPKPSGKNESNCGVS